MSAFIDANRERLGVEPICREIEVSASAYRARRRRPPSSRSLRDAFLLGEIRRVHEGSSGVYGQLEVWDELNDEGTCVARCTVERLMRRNGIVGVGPLKTKKTTLPGLAPVAAPDLVRQYFPKGTDLSRHSARELAAVATALNTRPRKTLSWRTPAEAFDELLRSVQEGSVATTP